MNRCRCRLHEAKIASFRKSMPLDDTGNGPNYTSLGPRDAAFTCFSEATTAIYTLFTVTLLIRRSSVLIGIEDASRWPRRYSKVIVAGQRRVRWIQLNLG